jgi:hypothetical protein
MTIRLAALINADAAEPKVGHFRGLPPELTGGQDDRERLPGPRVVVIKEDPDGIFLYRYTEDGSVVGDTWHQSVDEAKEQASFEYGELLNEWREVPSDVSDPVAFALNVDV